MQKNHFWLVKKLKNTDSAQLLYARRFRWHLTGFFSKAKSAGHFLDALFRRSFERTQKSA